MTLSHVVFQLESFNELFFWKLNGSRPICLGTGFIQFRGTGAHPFNLRIIKKLICIYVTLCQTFPTYD